MTQITVSYQDNRNYGLEERIIESAQSLQGSISDFEFRNGVFTADVKFRNQGQEENFKSSLQILEKAFKIPLILGGIINV